MLTTMTVSPRPLALARMFLGAGAFLTALEGAIQLSHLRDGRLLTPVHDSLPTAASLSPDTWFLVMFGAALLLALGVLARPAAVLLGAGNLLLLLTDQQLYSNHRILLVLLCLWMALSQCDRAWSVRALRHRDRNQRPQVPWWPALLIVATVSSCYLFAGLSKINPEFLSGRVIESTGPDWLPAQLVAWATVPTEVAIGLGVWWRRSRRPALALGAALHTSIIVLLDSPLPFTAFALICLTAYPLAWAWPSTERESTPAAASASSS